MIREYFKISPSVAKFFICITFKYQFVKWILKYFSFIFYCRIETKNILSNCILLYTHFLIVIYLISFWITLHVFLANIFLRKNIANRYPAIWKFLISTRYLNLHTNPICTYTYMYVNLFENLNRNFKNAYRGWIKEIVFAIYWKEKKL